MQDLRSPDMKRVQLQVKETRFCVQSLRPLKGMKGQIRTYSNNYFCVFVTVRTIVVVFCS